MELDNLQSAFDLEELLGLGNGGTESISRGVFAFKGAVTRSGSKLHADSPLQARKGTKTLSKSQKNR